MKAVYQQAICAACLAAVTGLAQADTLGFNIGGYFWQQNYDGTVRSSNLPVDQLNVEEDLGIDNDEGSAFYIAFEHPIPLLPNIMLQHTVLEVEDTAQPSRSFEFDGVVYSASDTVTTTSDLSHTDATLYYEVLDNWVSLDLGLTLRYFGESVRLNSATSGEGELELDETIPLIYLSAKGELPLTGFYARAEANGISYDGSKLMDYRVSLGYETDFGVGVELGLRNFDVDYKDGNDRANMTVDGGYAGVFYHF